MFARVTTYPPVPREHTETAIHTFRESVVPTLEKMAGFRGIYGLLDREIGESLTVSLWDTMEQLQASETAAGQMRAQAVQEAGLTQQPIVKVYEVTVHP